MQDHWTHQRHPGTMCTPRERVCVRHQLRTQFEVAAQHRLDLRAVRPGQVVTMRMAVQAEHRAKSAKLEPAHQQLGIGPAHLVEPADVRAPERHAGHAHVEPDRDLLLQGFEAAVDIAGPRSCSQALHARPTGAAEQEGAAIRTVSRLSFEEGELPQQVVAVVQDQAGAALKPGSSGWTFAAVQPPALDAQREQRAVRVPPPAADLRVGEVEEALPFAVVGGALRMRPLVGVAVIQQVALCFRFGMQRRVHMQGRVFVAEHPEPGAAHLRQQPFRVRCQDWIELQVADAAVPALAVVIGGQENERIARQMVLP